MKKKNVKERNDSGIYRFLTNVVEQML